jgi:L-lysine exporter family protein LysE/ArgO
MSTSQIITSLTAGFLFSLSLIVAIGPQTAFVMHHGVRRTHAGTVVALCTASDAILITAGVAGVGILLSGRPWLLAAMRWGGVALLATYGLLAARRAVHPAGTATTEHDPHESRRATIAACLGFTWLNPAVYLDTVILMGSVANTHPTGRWYFTLGAIGASAAWFSVLGFATAAFAPLLRHRYAERLLDGFLAGTMGLGAVRLLLSL